MFKIVRILFQSTVCFAFYQSEDKCFRHQSIEKVIFPKGGIPCGDNETLAFDAANRMDGQSFFQCDFVGHRNAWVDFHFTYLEISICEFHSVISIVFGGHQTELIAASIPNNFQIYLTQQETFRHEYVAEYRSCHFNSSTCFAKNVSRSKTCIACGTGRGRICDIHFSCSVFVIQSSSEL